MSFLSLWLEAPLQSWGHDSKFSRRDTLDFPTKSGVLGLFCCALGAGGEQTQWLSQWAKASMTVFSFVRVDKTGGRSDIPTLEDFHMVGSDYDANDPWQNLLIPKTSEGKKQVGSGAKITQRHYLQDMAFGVIMQAPDEMIQDVAQALQEPVWDIYLGRKSCAPTETLYRGIFDHEDDAITCLMNLAAAKSREASFKVLEGAHDGEMFYLNDVPVRFGADKVYADRQVTVVAL